MNIKHYFGGLASLLIVACQTAPTLTSLPPVMRGNQMSQFSQPQQPQISERPNLNQELNQLSVIVRQKIFSDRDLNRDQVLTRDEFGPPGLDDYEQIFQSIDANRDQTLALSEVMNGPALHYMADVAVMKQFLQRNVDVFKDSFDRNQDQIISEGEMYESVNNPNMNPTLRNFLVSEFRYRDLNQDQVLEGQEADLFSFMFYYKYGMPDVTLPSEKNKTL